MQFIDALEKVLDTNTNVSITENGAVGYKTTGTYLLDMNFKVASYRHMSEDEILTDWEKAFSENAILALKWLFYSRDVREGLGERRLFRTIFKYLAREYLEIIEKLIPLIAEYGRWDDLFILLNTSAKDAVISIIKETLAADVANATAEKSITLLAKWLPSENSSSKKSKELARLIMKECRISPRKYRKILSSLRRYLNVTEVKMSANEWTDIDYEVVPSKANLIYNSAFLRRDEERRRKFLEKVSKGTAKINAGVLYPHEIVHKYTVDTGWYLRMAAKADAGIEALWKALPNFGLEDTITVADGSGSMTVTVDRSSSVCALEVANALAIYTAQHCKGEFKNKYITFSNRPQLVHLTGDSLYENLQIAQKHNEVADTNIQAVFDLILKTAVNTHCAQEELPKNILIISDMEFNSAAGYYGRYENELTTLFDHFRARYAEYGYILPKLIFWNVNSRTCTIPVKENKAGVALVSGFSLNILKMVMSNKLDPFEILCDTLNSERYAVIEKALAKVENII